MFLHVLIFEIFWYNLKRMLLNSFKTAELLIDFPRWLLKVKKDEILHFDELHTSFLGEQIMYFVLGV